MAPESRDARRRRARRVLDRLCRRYPEARCALEARDPWQLLVSVVLSAQCTDARVNEATPALFARFPGPAEMARARPDALHPYIARLGLYRTKAHSLVATARRIVEDLGGDVPGTRAALAGLPGIGPKSAGVIAANAFGEPALPVDTHVGRIARRLGLTREHDPDRVERDLCALWPRKRWLVAHHALIHHGRALCTARRPACGACPVAALCPSAEA